MSVRFAAPLALLLLALVAVAGASLRRAELRRGRPVRRSRVLLHWVGSVLVALAAAQPQLRLHSATPTVMAVDVSAGIDSAMRASERAWVAAALPECSQICHVVTFDGATQVTAATAGWSRGSTADRLVADPGAGLLAAVRLAPSGSRVVLLSGGSGASDAGSGSSLQAAVTEARARAVRIDTVLLSDRPRDAAPRDAAVTVLQAPSVVHAGDSIPLRITVRSSVAARARLYVSRDGVSDGTWAGLLARGDNPFLLSYTATPGWHTFQARIEMPGDAIAQNNVLAATVHVTKRPRVMVLAGTGDAGPVPGMLQREGFTVSLAAPRSLASTVAGLKQLDAVVLDDVDARSLSRSQMQALGDSVRQDGLGLVALGGPHSFSLGHYAHTILDRLLPVSSLVPGDLKRSHVAIELVLDRSGSMIEPAGGVAKIEMVHVAGAEVARSVASRHDWMGVVDFDYLPHLLVPMQQITNSATEHQVIDRVTRLQANGGTEIYPALAAGLAQLARSRAPDKHMILMTDGIAVYPASYKPLYARARKMHVPVATIALGADADTGLLRRIARATGGAYHQTDDAHQLPAIFSHEAGIDVKPVLVKGHLSVSTDQDSALIRSLEGRVPPALSGSVVTTLKPAAAADLVASGRHGASNPALAHWQLGDGRVVAAPSGWGEPWAGAWTARGALLNDVVRWAARPPSAPAPLALIQGPPAQLRVDTGIAESEQLGGATLMGSLTSSAGRRWALTLLQSAPGIYSAPAPQMPPGVYSYTLRASSTASVRLSGELAVPYPAVFEPHPADDTELGAVAALTGGRSLTANDPGAIAAMGWQALWWAAALAGLVAVLAGFALQAIDRPAATAAGGGYAETSAAAPASRSTGSTSVGARM